MSKRLIMFITMVVSVVVLFIPLSLNFSNNGVPFCPLSVANAQDNPCLSQDATISAQELRLFQLEVTNVAMQSTITAYETSGVTISDTTDQAVAGLPFIETFENNDNGWRLIPGVSLVSGVLNLQSDRETSPIVPIPPVSNFCLTVEVIDDGTVAVLVGDIDNGTLHAFAYNDNYNDFEIWENVDFRFTQNVYDINIAEAGHPFVFRIDYQNGQFDIYINENYVMTGQLALFGGQIALGTYEDAQQFDNLDIRASC